MPLLDECTVKVSSSHWQEAKKIKIVFIQYAVHKFTFLSTSSLGEELIVMYTGAGEVWCTALWW